jgi:precorrin-6A/cobalt-precorrin-6A reductase
MTRSRPRLLILGGTAEAVALARRCTGRFAVTTALAGATDRPARPPGAVRIGGFGGAEGLRRYLAEAGIDLVVDATHPFAARMQAQAAEACARAGVPRCRLLRPEWPRQAADRWIEVADVAGAAAALAALGPRVFLALGARDLPAFRALEGRWFLVRGATPPAAPIANGLFVQARGPFALDDERRLLREHRIDAVVSRQSGGEGARAKIDAARERGLPVVMIRRPPPPPPPLEPGVEEVLGWLDRHAPAAARAEGLARPGPAGAV